MKTREAEERRRQSDRRQRDRRQQRVTALQAELEPLRARVMANDERMRELEAEQKVQLVRIAQIQRELDDLKKTKA